MRIEIAGPIGSGKSSYAKLFLDHGYEAIFEEFHVNPFWKAFYSNPNKYNFETEITFLLQHYHQIKRKSEETGNILICDFSFSQDMGYAKMDLTEHQIRIFTKLYEQILGEIGEPFIILHLQCRIETLLKRIQLRSRPEEQLISSEFLEKLDQYVKAEVNEKKQNSKIKIVEIDTEKIDIISNVNDQKAVLLKMNNLRDRA